MESLSTAFKSMRGFAKEIDYEHAPINSLADGYCDATDAGDEAKRNAYISALTLRFWYKVGQMAQENTTLGITREDALSWLTGAILDACQPSARVWRRPGSKVGAQQAINQVLATRYVAAAYYESNLEKNKGKAFTASLDAPIDEEGKQTIGDFVSAGEESDPGKSRSVSYVVQDLIDNDKLVEAIIVDNIVTKDVFRHTKEFSVVKGEDGKERKVASNYSSFWPFRLVKELGSLDESYEESFLDSYDVPKKAFEAAFQALKKANNRKKYMMVSAAVGGLRETFVS